MTETTASGEARHDAGAVARAGVYANHVEIVVGDRELTFDFVRIDPDNRAPAREILVARVAMTTDTFHDLSALVADAPNWWSHRGRVRRKEN